MEKLKDVDKVRGLTREDFFATYFNKEPVILQGAIDHWEATRKWSPEFFAERYGDELISLNVYVSGEGQTFLDSVVNDSGREAPLREFVEYLKTGENRYAIRDDFELFDRSPELLEDIDFFSHFCRREDVVDEAFYKSWFFGPANYYTGLHGDRANVTNFNIFGSKRFVLFDLAQTPFVYQENVGQKEFSWELSERDIDNYQEGTTWAAADPFSPDYDAHPLLKKAKYYDALLGPAEVLYIPDAWWHAVHSLSIAMGVVAAFDIDHFLLHT